MRLSQIPHALNLWIKRVTRQHVEAETTPWGDIPRVPDEWERMSHRANAQYHAQRNGRKG